MVSIFGLKPQTVDYALKGVTRLAVGAVFLWECQWIALNHLKFDLTKSINRSTLYATVITGAISFYFIFHSAAYFMDAYRIQKGLTPLQHWKWRVLMVFN